MGVVYENDGRILVSMIGNELNSSVAQLYRHFDESLRSNLKENNKVALTSVRMIGLFKLLQYLKELKENMRETFHLGFIAERYGCV